MINTAIPKHRKLYAAYLFFWIVLAALLILSGTGGCSPKVSFSNDKEYNPFPPTQPFESFATVEANDYSPSEKDKLITDMEVKGNLLYGICDFESVKQLAETQARERGGNCLRITERIKPEQASGCYRIKAQVLRIEHPERYETLIRWNSQRLLTSANFQGETDKRPFQAGTYTGIRQFVRISPWTGKATLTIECIFDCRLSYFKPSDADSFVLAHEQVHFDIAEVYARKLRKMIREDFRTYDEYTEKRSEVFGGIQKELFRKQDEYDAEVYSDISMQQKWNEWVRNELRQLDAYSSTEIQL